MKFSKEKMEFVFENVEKVFYLLKEMFSHISLISLIK